MKTYWALVSFIEKLEGQWRHRFEERSHTIRFKAESHRDAVKGAVLFARDREKTFQNWTFAALKIGVFEASPIMKNGILIQADHPYFFEWKYDWPGTVEDHVESKVLESWR